MCHSDTTTSISTMLTTDNLENTLPSVTAEQAETKALRRKRRASRTWGRSAPPSSSAARPMMRPKKSESHSLPVVLDIVTAELEEELLALADKTRCAISESYAEVDVQRRSRDEATSVMEDLEMELAALTEEKEERDCPTSKAQTFKTKLQRHPFARRLSNLMMHLPSETTDEDESYPGIQKSRSVSYDERASSCSSPSSEHDAEETTSKVHALAKQVTTLQENKRGSIELLGTELRNYESTEYDLLDTVSHNKDRLAQLRADITDVIVRQKARKSDARAEALKLQEEIVRLNSSIKAKARYAACASSPGKADPLANFVAFDRDGQRQQHQQGQQQQQQQSQTPKRPSVGRAA